MTNGGAGDPPGVLKLDFAAGSGFIDKFKAFIRRGNVIDLAVGVIIGGAFGKIVSSLVADIIMPPLGMLLARLDFRSLKWTLKPAQGQEPAVTVNYGAFLSTCLDFLLVALVIFLAVEIVHRVHKAPPPVEPQTRECPFCASSIPKRAIRCPQCIVDLCERADRLSP